MTRLTLRGASRKVRSHDGVEKQYLQYVIGLDSLLESRVMNQIVAPNII